MHRGRASDDGKKWRHGEPINAIRFSAPGRLTAGVGSDICAVLRGAFPDGSAAATTVKLGDHSCVAFTRRRASPPLSSPPPPPPSHWNWKPPGQTCAACVAPKACVFSSVDGERRWNPPLLARPTVPRTGPPDRMSQRKWRSTKQHPSRARAGYQISCCLLSLHFLCDILSGGPVETLLVNIPGNRSTPEVSPINRYGSTVAKFLTVHRSEKVV